MQLTHIGEIVTRWEADTPDREALRFRDRVWTWSQWGERIRRAASAQLAAGLRTGDRVASLDRNHPVCLETTCACALAGTVHAIVNWRLAAEEVAYVVDDAQARVLFVGAEFLPVVERIRDTLRTVERIVVVGGGRDEYEGWLDVPARSLTHEPTPDHGVLQLYTSGTTGFPKGATLTHRGLAAHTTAVASRFGIDADCVSLVAMPLFHVGGSGYALLSMYAGGRTVLMREVDPVLALDLIGEQRVTHGFFVPAVYGLFLHTPGVAERDVSSVRCFAYGAAPMPLPLLRRCLAAFPVDFYQVYGMTELCGVVTVLGTEEHRDPDRPERLLSAGRPIGDVEIRVVDPLTGEDAADRGDGEVWVRTSQHMAEYWRRPEATAATLRPDGWLRTGDVGHLDDDGYLYIVDRTKDMIISGGENIYPAEIERVLAEHPAVADLAVIGVPDERWGESVKAFVVARPEHPASEAELIEYCRRHLAGFKIPRTVDFLDDLPRNPTGKLLKYELRKPYWEGRDRAI
jgi:acyl-CoA synthetase (AMP-forming)/AMP-acid ligase II